MLETGIRRISVICCGFGKRLYNGCVVIELFCDCRFLLYFLGPMVEVEVRPCGCVRCSAPVADGDVGDRVRSGVGGEGICGLRVFHLRTVCLTLIASTPLQTPTGLLVEVDSVISLSLRTHISSGAEVEGVSVEARRV